MKKQLHIYCRVSSEQQLEGHSLEAQKKEGIRKAEQLGMTPVFFVERGRSAAKDNIDNRPELQKLLTLCDSGEVTDVFVTELDRLSRSVIVMESIKIIFRENDILLHTISSRVNFDDTEQEFVTDILSLLARRENTLKSIRSKRGLAEAVKSKGHWIGIMVPYGYRKVGKAIEPDPEEAEVVKLMFKLCLEGNGTNTIAKKLNELNIETRAKKVLLNGTKVVNKYTKKIRKVKNKDFIWRAGTVYCILTNPLLIGKRRYKGETISAPAIIDETAWDRVQQQLKRNKNCSSNHHKHFYLLKGLLRCGRCENNLYGKIKSDERVYMCSSKRTLPCGLRSPNLDKLNEVVWNQIALCGEHLQIILDKRLKEEPSGDAAQLKGEIKLLKKHEVSIKRRSENLIILFENGRISLSEFDERYSVIQAEGVELGIKLTKAKEQLESMSLIEKRLNDTIRDMANMKQYLLDLDEKSKQDILLDVVEDIKVFWDEQLRFHLILFYLNINGIQYVTTQYIFQSKKTLNRIKTEINPATLIPYLKEA